MWNSNNMISEENIVIPRISVTEKENMKNVSDDKNVNN